jgi:hypothetical protein
VVLTTNALEDTRECIRSLRATTYGNLGVVVADNASKDGTEEIIGREFPGVQILQLGRNAGFAAGNNAGIRLALARNPDFVLLLNNDTVVDPGFLEPMVIALEKDPGAACATGTICYHPETDILWYAGGDLVWWRGSGFSRHQEHQLRSINKESIQDVTFVSGCLMLLRRQVIEDVGFLEEKTFLYCEDTEYSLRLTSAGYRMVYVPNTRIFHKTAHRNRTPFALYYTVRNRLLVIALRLRGWRRVAAMAYVAATSGFKIVLWRFRQPDLSRAAAMGLVDYFRGNLYEGRGLEFPYRRQEQISKA